MSIPANFWSEVEKPLQFVLYSDTDSLYINVPSIVPIDTEDAIKHADKLSTEINNVIQGFMNSVLLPKQGVTPDFNKTYFKTELTADAIMFLDTKKNYAYRQTSKKGFETEPKVKYTGISVVKSDTAKFTADIIREIVENIAMKSDLKNPIGELQIVAKKFSDLMHTHAKEFKFQFIGKPCKWGSGTYVRDTNTITAMKLYNTITETETFKPMTSGFSFPINLKNYAHFTKLAKRDLNPFTIGKTPLMNLTYLAVPYNYEPQKIRTAMEQFGITIDTTQMWEILYNKVARRIVDTIKGSQ